MPSPIFKAGQTTLGNVRNLVRSRADLEDGALGPPTFVLSDTRFIKDGEIDAWAQLNQTELYDELISKYSDDWFLKSDPQIIVTNGSEFYDLADDYYNLRGVSWITAPGSQLGNVTLKPFMMGERDVFTLPTFPITAGFNAPRYKLVNSNPARLWLRPVPQTALTLQVWYSPRLTVPQEYFVINFNELNLLDVINIELNDNGNVAFTCVTTPANATQFAFNADPVIIASNFATVFNAFAASSRPAFYRSLSALANGSMVAIAVQGRAVMTPSVVTYSYVPSSDVSLSFWPQDVSTDAGCSGSISNVIDGVNGWEQWIITQCCINACQKQREPADVFLAQMQVLKKRLDVMATQRDSGMPQTVTDTRYAGGGAAGFMFGSEGDW